jgi:transposase InsO family protein
MIGAAKMSLEVRERAEREVTRLEAKTGLALPVLLGFAGIPERTWREWQERNGVETRHNSNIPRGYYLTPAETEAIANYCRGNCATHPEKGYRTLCWEMVDKNIAFVGESSVYNVIKRYKLAQKGDELTEQAEGGFVQPAAVHEQWHIDFSHIKIRGSFYYFVSILDGYSRRILNWRLCDTMEGINAEVLATETKELYPEAKAPRLISDNGSQFISKDFKELLIVLEIGHTFTRANHPQSNGKLERFHRTLKTEHTRRSAYVDDADARVRMALWLAYYNSERLHSALGYLTPDDVFYGRSDSRLAERREKLHTARINRQEYWQALAVNP